MLYLKAILQAIAQAICEIFPLSYSGFSAIYRDFSNDFSGNINALTGVIHIGIAVGILVSFFKMFWTETAEFVNGFGELFKKEFSLKNSKKSRIFTYASLISFSVFLILIIPAGDYGNVCGFMRYFSYNGTVFGEGIAFLLTAGLLYGFTKVVSSKNRKERDIDWVFALVAGLTALVAVNTSGFSVIVSVLCVGTMMGVSRRVAGNYAFALAFPIFLGKGIVEIVSADIEAAVIPSIIAVVLAVAITFVASRVFMWTVRKNYLNYFMWYNLGIGSIVTVVGVVQLFIR